MKTNTSASPQYNPLQNIEEFRENRSWDCLSMLEEDEKRQVCLASSFIGPHLDFFYWSTTCPFPLRRLTVS